MWILISWLLRGQLIWIFTVFTIESGFSIVKVVRTAEQEINISSISGQKRPDRSAHSLKATSKSIIFVECSVGYNCRSLFVHIECHTTYTMGLIKAFSVLKYKWYALRQYAMQTDLLTLYLLVLFRKIFVQAV